MRGEETKGRALFAGFFSNLKFAFTTRHVMMGDDANSEKQILMKLTSKKSTLIGQF